MNPARDDAARRNQSTRAALPTCRISQTDGEILMFRSLLLWLIGIPIPIIILLWLFVF